MNLVIYLGKRVHVVLLDKNYYYIGQVIGADSDSLTIRDKLGKLVSISKLNIASIKEVQQ